MSADSRREKTKVWKLLPGWRELSLLLVMRFREAKLQNNYKDAAALLKQAGLQSLEMKFEVTEHTPTTVRRYLSAHSMRMMDILKQHKLNSDRHDRVTKRQDDCLKLVQQKGGRHLLILAAHDIIFFNSRAWLDRMEQKLSRIKDGALTADVLRDMATKWGTCNPATCFTTSFNPQLVRHRELLKTRSQKDRARKVLQWYHKSHSKFAAKGPLHIMRNGKKVTERTFGLACSQRMGAFSGKNLHAVLDRWVFKKAKHRQNIRKFQKYTLSGPGCRGFCNLVQGAPETNQKYTNTAAAHDAFNEVIAQYEARLQKDVRCLLAENWVKKNATVREAVQDVLAALSSRLFVQFAFCEFYKLSRTLRAGKVLYPRAGALNEEDAEGEESDSDAGQVNLWIGEVDLDISCPDA